MTLKKKPEPGIYFSVQEISSEEISEIAESLGIGYLSGDDFELYFDLKSYDDANNSFFVVASKGSMQMILTKTPRFSDGPMRKEGCQKVEDWFE